MWPNPIRNDWEWISIGAILIPVFRSWRGLCNCPDSSIFPATIGQLNFTMRVRFTMTKDEQKHRSRGRDLQGSLSSSSAPGIEAFIRENDSKLKTKE